MAPTQQFKMLRLCLGSSFILSGRSARCLVNRGLLIVLVCSGSFAYVSPSSFFSFCGLSSSVFSSSVSETPEVHFICLCRYIELNIFIYASALLYLWSGSFHKIRINSCFNLTLSMLFDHRKIGKHLWWVSYKRCYINKHLKHTKKVQLQSVVAYLWTSSASFTFVSWTTWTTLGKSIKYSTWSAKLNN